MFVYFTSYNGKRHNLPKIISIALKNVFSLFMVFENTNDTICHGFGNLVIWLWKSFRNILRVVCMDLDCNFEL